MPSDADPVRRDVDRCPSRVVVGADHQHVRHHNALADRLEVVVVVPCSVMVVEVRTAGGMDRASIGGTEAARDVQRIGEHSRANEADF